MISRRACAAPTVSQYESMRTAAASLKPTGISASLLDSNQWHNLLHARSSNQALDRSHKVLQYCVHLNIIQVWKRRKHAGLSRQKKEATVLFLSRCVNKKNKHGFSPYCGLSCNNLEFFFSFFVCMCAYFHDFLFGVLKSSIWFKSGAKTKGRTRIQKKKVNLVLKMMLFFHFQIQTHTELKKQKQNNNKNNNISVIFTKACDACFK